MTNIESKVERKRFEVSMEEVIAFCKMSDGGEPCSGIRCPLYQTCWKNLNPDKEGYFDWIGKRLNELKAFY